MRASKAWCDLPCFEAKKIKIGFGLVPCVDFFHSWELVQSIKPELVNGIGVIDAEHSMEDLLELIPSHQLQNCVT